MGDTIANICKNGEDFKIITEEKINNNCKLIFKSKNYYDKKHKPYFLQVYMNFMIIKDVYYKKRK